jgi:murein DD-endopeptidase MepM/ murein hydrolase activator NlpD
MERKSPDNRSRDAARGPPLSHDPRSWFPRAEATPPEKRHPPPGPRRRLGLYAAACLLIAAGLVISVLHTNRPPQPAPPKKAAAVAMASERVMALAPGEELSTVLRELGAASDDVENLDRAAEPFLPSRRPLLLHLSLRAGPQGEQRVASLTLERPDGDGVALRRGANGYSASPLSAHLQLRVRDIRGEMNGENFYSSAVAAGIDDSIIPEIVSALSYDFDFVREIHPGDVFEVAIAESLNPHGDAVGPKRLLYVSVVTSSRSLALYRFAASGARSADWFDAEGRSIRRALMRTPVDGARVTSDFGMRIHPVLGYTMMHKGVDFGAPVGTPVYASGDGVVTAIGPRGTYGLYIRIDHTKSLATAYAHLSAFPPGLAIGSRVRQGQTIAFSGNTGRTTGPHLHYEVLVDNVQVDPMKMTLEQNSALAGPVLAAFRTERSRIDEMRTKGG